MITAVVLAAGARRFDRTDVGPRALALVLVGSTVLGLRLVSLAQYRYVPDFGVHNPLVVVLVSEAVAVVIVVGVAAVIAARSLSRPAALPEQPARSHRDLTRGGPPGEY